MLHYKHNSSDKTGYNTAALYMGLGYSYSNIKVVYTVVKLTVARRKPVNVIVLSLEYQFFAIPAL